MALPQQTLAIQQLFPSQSLVPEARQEIRYRALSVVEQTQKRIALYDALYPLTKESEIKIPYLKNYHGYDIFLSHDGNDLIMKGKTIYNFTIRLTANGEYNSLFLTMTAASRPTPSMLKTEYPSY
ncbi:MAG TPA: hypothetical protein VHK67_02385 [Rhabdochlamydiaceae bacterium]|jgi:hypothetical protein|nr:hypothetical protein [Rhabdochlamydiaceae bacterium]